jgi:hypothetical protein
MQNVREMKRDKGFIRLDRIGQTPYLFSMGQSRQTAPEVIYRRRIEGCAADLRRLAKFDFALGAGKLAVLAVDIYLLVRIAAADRSPIFFGIVLGIFLAAALAHGVVLRKKRRLSVFRSIQEGEIRALGHEFLEVDDGRSAEEAGHPYAADLELFGPRSVFHFLNRTATKIGRDRLTGLLKGTGAVPARGEILARQDAVRELAPALDFRHELRVRGFDLGDAPRKSEGLARFLSEPSWVLRRPVFKILLHILPFFAVGAAAGLFFGLPRWIFYLCLLVNGLMVLAGEKRCARTYALVSKTNDVLKSYALILGDLERTEFRSAHLNGLKDRMVTVGAPASVWIRRLSSLLGLLEFRTGQIIYVAVNVLVLWDLHALLWIERWRRATAGHVPVWLEVIAEFDAISSLANASFNNPTWAFPEITGEGPRFEMEAAGNPLIAPRERVDNDLIFGLNPRIAIVTGPNMAGKSTFLKTVGVNLALAFAGGPVCALRMAVSPAILMTSMKVNDSLDQGLSLFHAELRRLKEILDPIKEGKPVLFLIDEMLKGTNAADRQVGSIALLRQTARRPVSGIVATHDLQLTDLEKEFPGRVLNFHFDGRVEDDRLLFDFVLRPGRCESFNALILMKKMGIEV